MFVLKFLKGVFLFVGGMVAFITGIFALLGLGAVGKYAINHPREDEFEIGANVAKENFKGLRWYF